MSDAALVLRQAGYGLKSLSRNPRALVFTVAFPVILLLLFGSIFGSQGSHETTRLPGGGRVDANAYLTAGMIAYAIMMACYSSLAITLTTERESGQLKRFRGTPVPAWTFIVARIVRSIVLVAVITAALLILARIAFDVRMSAAGLAELVLFTVLGTAAMCALGVAITAITTTTDSASTIAPFSTVILSFISGVFIPIDQLPDSLVQLGRGFPLAHLAAGLQGAFAGSSVHLSAENVGVLALWGAVAVFVAARRFRWEPRGATA